VTHPPRLIGLYSPAPRSGKTTIARYLIDAGYETVSFAQPIKRMATILLMELGHDLDTIENLLEYGKGDTIPGIKTNLRHILQTLGTEWGRDCIHPEVWLMCWEHAATRQLNNGFNVVCDDIRFPNEAALIRRLGGEIWCVTRPGTERGTSHSSEGSLDNYPLFDRRILNDGTLLNLYDRVQSLTTRTPTAA
jgi:hypothetical protein